MRDDDKPPIFISSNPSSNRNYFYRAYVDSFKISKKKWIGIDFAVGNGMIRGEVIERKDNVIHVRFNTVN